MKTMQTNRPVGIKSLLVATLAGITLSLNANAAVVFQADFNGSGTGTGGPSDIVTSGGTGSLATRGNSTTSVITGSPLATGGGGYLNVNRAAAATATGFAGVNLTPAGSGNWLNSWYTDGGANDTLVGGMDFFFQQSSTLQAANTFGFIFTENSNTNGLRLELTTINATQIQLALRSYNSGGATLLGSDTVTFDFAAGQLYHVAVVADGAAGATRVRAFIESGNVGISPSTATAVATLSGIDLDADNQITNSFALTEQRLATQLTSWSGETGELNVSWDQFRVYNAVPTTFSAIPEPSSALFVALGLAGLAIRRRRSAI